MQGFRKRDLAKSCIEARENFELLAFLKTSSKRFYNLTNRPENFDLTIVFYVMFGKKEKKFIEKYTSYWMYYIHTYIYEDILRKIRMQYKI